MHKKLEGKTDRCVSVIVSEASVGHRASPGSLKVDS